MPFASKRAGFTLIELVAVCAVLAILAAVAIPATGARLLDARIDAEAAELRRLGAAVQSSFESTDLEGTNLAALPGTLPAGVDPTAFSASTDMTTVPATTNSWDWFAKLAKQLGETPQPGVPPTWNAQPRIAAVLQNASHLTRIFLLGPSNEAAQQRFLLLSLVAAPGQLSLPPLPSPSNPQDPGNLAWFNDAWNTDWTNPGAVLPPSWTAALSPSQAAAWMSAPKRLRQLCVQRIVCPRYSVTVSDTHPTDNCYVYFNLNGTTAGANATAAANSGAFALPGILGGRTIQAYRGTQPPPVAQLFAQFILRDHAEITVQD